jgi:predicted N-formylglutamate amidohydrolase
MYHRDARLAQALLGQLRADPALCVGDNEPYAMGDTSDHTLPVHGEGRGILHVGIEIRQDLLSDSAGQQSWADRLAILLPRALEAVTTRG